MKQLHSMKQMSLFHKTYFRLIANQRLLSSDGFLSKCSGVNIKLNRNPKNFVKKSNNVNVQRYAHTSTTKPYPVLDVAIDKNASDFNRNLTLSKKREELLVGMLEKSRIGGGPKAIERHTKRHKKLLVQDRLRHLLDDLDDFLELSPVAGLGMEYGDVPRAGVVTGIGKVNGKYCMIVANDATVKGGSVYPVTLKKQLRAQEIALQNRLPCIYVVDSGGAFLPLQSQIFNPGGQTFYNEAVMSSLQIPQVAIVCGSCTAGGAYVPTMAEEAIIVHRMGTIFLGGPPLVQAATGEIITAEDLGGATLHSKVSGCTDHFAATEEEAHEMGRDIIATLNIECHSAGQCDSEPPVFDTAEMPGLLSEGNQSIDMYRVIGRLVDGSRFREFKKLFGSTLITGFGFIEGHLTGILGNQGELSADAAVKGSHFVQLCAQRHIPLVFLQNTAADDAVSDIDNIGEILSERLKAQGKMLSAVSCAAVPKITVIVGNGTGPTHYIMGGRAVSPNFLFTWPNAVIGIMEPEMLATSIAQERAEKDVDVDKLSTDLLELLKTRTSAMFTSTRVLDDGVILPQDTRRVLGQCLSIVSAYVPRETTRYPVFRM